MGRKDKAEAAAAAAANVGPPKQMLDYAFNLYGWAIEIPAELRMGPIFINAEEDSSTPWETATKTAQAKGQNPFRSSISFTASEMREQVEPGERKYLVVGITFHKLGDLEPKWNKIVNKAQPVGHVIKDNIISSKDGDMLPILVVTKVLEEESNIHLRALINPRNGLCRPHHISKEHCFYFPMFRDSSTAYEQRSANWSRLVADIAVKTSSTPVSKKQAKYLKARNTTKVILEPIVSLRNEICCLVESFAASGQMWHLEELEYILEKADEDLKHAPPVANTNMHLFLSEDEDDDEAFGDEEAEGMLKELEEYWSDLEGVTARRLILLRKQIVENKVEIEYKLLRPFITEACHLIQEIQDGRRLFSYPGETELDAKKRGGVDPDISGLLEARFIVTKALGTVQRVLGSSKSGHPIPPEEGTHLLTAVLNRLRDIRLASDKFDEASKDSCGDQTNAGTLHDIWERYKNALDTDSAKLSWFEGFRYEISQLKYKHRGVSHLLEEVVEALEEMKI
jgi:hypothetical protein